MAHIVEDRILESTTTTGTGALALAAAITGFRRFNAVCAVGDTVPYFAEAIDSLGQPTGDYEYGIGTYSAANQLTRTKVLGSSNGGALVNFAAGSKNVGVAALGSDMLPTGMLGEFLTSTPPRGWLERDGSLVSRAQYPALWAHAQAGGCITATDVEWASDKRKFSPGDGATTFRLPDHRGYHMRAWDHGAGVDAGRTLGSEQADQFPSHNHAIITTGDPGSGGTTGMVRTNTGAPAGSLTTQIAAAGAGAETRVKTVAVLACIKT